MCKPSWRSLYVCFSLKQEPEIRVTIAVQRLDLTESTCLNLVVLIFCFQTQSLGLWKDRAFLFLYSEWQKKTPKLAPFFLQTPNLHKSGEVRAMTLIIFILFKLSTVGWDNETLMLYCTCMPKFHCRSRQWICQFSLRSHSEK